MSWDTETLSQGLFPIVPLLPGSPKYLGNLIADVKQGRSVFCLSGLGHGEGWMYGKGYPSQLPLLHGEMCDLPDGSAYGLEG